MPQLSHNKLVCTQCRKAQQGCKSGVKANRFNQCGRCFNMGKDGAARPLCSLSYSQGSVRFYATDFIFKHAPHPYGFDEYLEYQPAGPGYDAKKDECHYGMQYFYIEEPYETSAPWSPLFTRAALQHLHIASPYHLTPMVGEDQETPPIQPCDSETLKKAWDIQTSSDAGKDECRPTFCPEEKVITCRRICTLYGYLDLENPVHFRRIILQAGFYRVTWRLQFFDVRYRQEDFQEIYRRLQNLNDEMDEGKLSSMINASCRNPFKFPQWLKESNPSLPNRPLLRLSIGYGSSPRRVSDYKLSYGLDKEALANQVLLPGSRGSMLVPRLDYFVTANEYWQNIDNGWRCIESGGLFEILDGRPPVLMLSNIDTGDWQGGFRFGGVELRRVEGVS